MQCGYLVFKAENNVQNSVICSDGCSLCFLQLQMYILCMFFCGLLRIVILSQENLNMLWFYLYFYLLSRTMNINVCCLTAKNPRQGLTLAFQSVTRQQSDPPTRRHPSIPPSLSDHGVLERMDYPSRMYDSNKFFPIAQPTQLDSPSLSPPFSRGSKLAILSPRCVTFTGVDNGACCRLAHFRFYVTWYSDLLTDIIWGKMSTIS